MAVAVKPSPEKTSSNPLPSLPILSLFGMIYVIGSLALVFGLLPYLWWSQIWTGNPESFVGMALLGLLCVGSSIGLLVVGVRILGTNAPPGTRAGVFTAIAFTLLIMMLTRWIANFLEGWIYDGKWFGDSGPFVGTVSLAIIAGLMLLYVVRMFFRDSFQQKLVAFENQGWFSATSFKGQQGAKVRRATILGILLIAGAGIYSLVVRDALKSGDPTWGVNIPFTGKVRVTPQSAGDLAYLPVGDDAELKEYRDRAAEMRSKYLKDKNTVIAPIEIDRYTFRDKIEPILNKEKFGSEKYVKIDNPGGELKSKFDHNQIVTESAYEKEYERIEKDEGGGKLGKKDPQPVKGDVNYSIVPIFPNKQITVPLFLIAASLWLAWRIVNVPVFADFLIATEAEMNKVSWSSKRRLFQDTIVVLVTVFLMATYLFSMDVVWQQLLSSDMVQVIYVSEDQDKIKKGTDDRPLW